jgi:hypothetical protein
VQKLAPDTKYRHLNEHLLVGLKQKSRNGHRKIISLDLAKVREETNWKLHLVGVKEPASLF